MDTGLGFVQPMFFIGVVENRIDPRQEGRVQVRAFGVHGSNQDIPTEDLPWATLILGHHDVNFTPPPLNAWVFGFFIDGRDAQQPMILGLIPAQVLEPINPAVTGWGAVPAENYDRESLGSRPQDIGLSPMGRLATGEFTDETYITSLATNRETGIPIAGGVARNYVPGGNSFLDRGVGDEDTGGTSTRTSSATEKDIYRGLIERGIPDAAARGIIANMIAESNLNPGINEIAPLVPGSRGGFGLIQWTGPRRRALEAEARRRGVSVNNLDFQLDYLLLELQGPERRSYENLLRTNDPVEAARIFSEQNLRPGIPNLPKRLSEARRLANVDFGDTSSLADITPEEERRLDEQRTANQQRIAEIREELQSIESEISRIGGDPSVIPRRKQLEERKAELEEELRILGADSPRIPADPDSPEPYRGYMDYAPEDRTTWDEPEPAYNAQYPYNRAIETASGHAIEIDDTPGAERIMIYHQSGSYIQLSTTSTTHKTISDSYNIHDKNHHVYVGGTNILTIEGDYHLLVKGNYVEEVQGDYQQIVHGSSSMGAGRRLALNGADRTDIRGAVLGLLSDLDNLNITTKGSINFKSDDSINLSSKTVRLSADENLSVNSQNSLSLNGKAGVHLVSEGNVHINPDQNIFLRAEGGDIGMQSGTSISMNAASFLAMKSEILDMRSGSSMILDSGASINLNATAQLALNSSDGIFMKGTELHMKSDGVAKLTGEIVYIDDIVQLASGESAEVSEPIAAAPYGDSLDDVPPADADPGEIAPSGGSPATEADPAPPKPSLPETILT